MENAPLGLASAKVAGVGYVIGVTTTPPAEYLKGADDIMPSFADLEECLARRLGSRLDCCKKCIKITEFKNAKICKLCLLDFVVKIFFFLFVNCKVVKKFINIKTNEIINC